MLALSLAIIGVMFFIAAGTVVFVQYRALEMGKVEIVDGYDGPKMVSHTVNVIVRYFLKRSVYFRKICTQHVLHVFVRVMYYVDMFTTYLYTKSRNWFVSNAVKNKGTVSHFWEHLKVYKQEMDKEKTESGE